MATGELWGHLRMGVTGQAGSGRGRRLDSWKAIAQYLDRDVRSVQRWELERGLPVHRLPGQKSGAVFAFEGELEQWMLSRQDETPSSPDAEPVTERPPAAFAASDSTTQHSLGRFAWPEMVGIAVALLGVLFATIAVTLWRPAESPVRQSTASRSVAVLPMQNLSGDAAQDYFADGFTEELVTELAQLRSLRVISRTSTMIYKHSRKSLPEIARELHAKYILEGSILREGNRVRVIAQLIDAATDTHVSAHTYNADVKDVLDIQSRISRAIADDVRLDLSPQEKTRLARVR